MESLSGVFLCTLPSFLLFVRLAMGKYSIVGLKRGRVGLSLQITLCPDDAAGMAGFRVGPRPWDQARGWQSGGESMLLHNPGRSGRRPVRQVVAVLAALSVMDGGLAAGAQAADTLQTADE